MVTMATPGVLKSVGLILQLQDPSQSNEYLCVRTLPLFKEYTEEPYAL